MSDAINPDHYRAHPAFSVECIQVTQYMDFVTGNACKYLWRSGRKGDALEDLAKAYWYLEHLPAPNISILPQSMVDLVGAQARLYLERNDTDTTWLATNAILKLVLDDWRTAKDLVETAIQRESY